MRRRDFIKVIVGSAIAWPLSARAQQSEPTRRVGVLVPFTDDDPEGKTWLAAFQEGLQALGWEQNRNIRINYRWTAGDPTHRTTYAAELVGMRPDLLFVGGSPELAELHRQTATTPIVFVQVSDPLNLGIVTNLAHPGGNVTGYVNFEHSVGAKWLGLLKATAPDVSRVAVIFDPQNLAMTPYLQAVKAAAPSFRIQLTLAEVRSANDIENVVGAFAKQPNGGMIVLPNAVTLLHRDLIIALAATLRGAKPADLPVQYPTKFQLVVNLTTAKALGLGIPASVLSLADEMVE